MTCLVTRSTSTVEHLAIWAYDRENPESWATGRYVPWCASERNHGMWHLVETTWTVVLGHGPRKRLCKKCRTHLNEALNLALARLEAEDPGTALTDLLEEPDAD